MWWWWRLCLVSDECSVQATLDVLCGNLTSTSGGCECRQVTMRGQQIWV